MKYFFKLFFRPLHSWANLSAVMLVEEAIQGQVLCLFRELHCIRLKL